MCKNPQLKPEVLTDGYDRLVDVQVNLCGVKTLKLAVYAPNEGKIVFYKQFMERLIFFSYENWWLDGD